MRVPNPNNPVVILRSRWSLHLAIVPTEGAVLFELEISIQICVMCTKLDVYAFSQPADMTAITNFVYEYVLDNLNFETTCRILY